MHAILVQATPMDTDGDDYGIECSECGPVVLIDGSSAKAAISAHMAEHNATNVVSDVVDPPEFSD